MSTEPHVTDRPPGHTDPPTRVPAWLLWFAVVAGAAAWFVHLTTAWGVMELSCIAPTSGAPVLNQGGSPGPVAWGIAIGGTAIPWVVAAAALLACFVVRRRRDRLEAAGQLDVLARERINLLVVIGMLLDLLSLAAITGGAIALLTLRPCA
jgi:hypothetical protein